MNTLEKNPLKEDIEAVTSSDPIGRMNYISKIHVGNEVINPIKMLQLTLERNYVKNYSSKDMIELILQTSDLIGPITQYRQNITLLVEEYPLGREKLSKPTFSKEYKAIIMNEDDDSLDMFSEEMNKISKSDLDVVSLSRVTFQLIDKRVLEIQNLKTYGVFEGKTPLELLELYVAPVFNVSNINTLLPSTDTKLDIYPPDNEDICSTYILPSDTFVLNVPRLLQNDETLGFYNAGLGSFLQPYKDSFILFVFPLFAVDRINSINESDIYFYLLGGSAENRLEKTYMRRGKTTHVLSTGESGYTDNIYNKNTKTHSNSFTMNNDKISVRKPIIDRKDLPDEKKDDIYMTPKTNRISVKERKEPDGYEYTVDLKTPNMFTNSSKIMEDTGATRIIPWHDSRPDEIYPGMPCKIFYATGETTTESLVGIIIGAVHNTTSIPGSAIENNYVTNSLITVYTKKDNTIYNNGSNPTKSFYDVVDEFF